MKLPLAGELLPAPSALPPGGVAEKAATLTLEQVAQLSGVGAADLQALVEHGVLTPVMPAGEPVSFPLDCVMTLQRADHLRQDLALDDHGFALAMMLLGRITDLEDELRVALPVLQNPVSETQVARRVI
ncbi:MAG: chaperone modulator CbpM [Betaproteobacteria bacterium]